MATGRQPFAVELTPAALKELQALDHTTQERIVLRLEGLVTAPRPQGVEKLKGRTDRYRIRVGTFRVIYEINDDARRVVVARIAHRKDAYRP